MNILRKVIPVLFLLWNIAGYTQSTSINFNFQPVNSNEGQMSSKKVLCTIQDSRGFIWVGTQAGLNVYDGYKFTSFKYDVKDTNSVAGDYIKDVWEDKNHNMVICTNASLSCYDISSERFSQVKSYNELNKTSSSLFASSSFQLKNKDIFFIIQNELYKYDADNKVAILIKSTINQLNYSGEGEYLPNTEDENGTIWLAYHKTLVGYNSTQNKSFAKTFENIEEYGGERIGSIFTYDKNRLGILTGNQLLLYNTTNEEIETTEYYNLPEDITDFGTLLSLRQDNFTTVWFTTEDSRIFTFDPQSRQFEHYVIYDENGNKHGRLRAIIKDQQGIWWLGSGQNGLYFSYPDNQNSFKQLTAQADNPNSLSSNTVSAILKDTKGRLWIGTDGGGLNLYQPETGKYEHFLHNPSIPGSISTNAVLCLFEDSKENILIGGYNGGVAIYNENKNNFKSYLPDINNPNSISYHDVRGITEFNGTYYISLNGQVGLDKFDLETGDFTHFNFDTEEPGKQIVARNMATMLLDPNGYIWVGGYGGLSQYNPLTEKFQNFVYVEGDTTTLSNSWVYSLLIDKEGTLWVGTAYGLNRFDAKSKTFNSFTERNGLPDNIINGLLEDGDSNLWISTNKGISRFNKNTLEFRNFDKSDGLNVEQFIHGAIFKDDEGILYFGGTGGLVILDPQNFKKNEYVPKVFLTGLQLFYKPVKIGSKNSPLTKSIAYTEKIILTHKQNIVTFNYIALNYVSPQKNKYAYMLEGFDKEWNEVGSRREASYTNLSPGKYTFRVKASNNDNVWNNEGASIIVIVRPPWWKTKVFIFLVLATVAFLIYRAIKKRNHDIQRDKEILQSKIEEGQQELEKQRSKIENQQKVLIENEALRKELNWFNEGMTKMSEVISHNSGDLYEMTRKLINAVVEHVGANLACIYVINTVDGIDIFELTGAYGINQTKIKQSVPVTEGYLGACYADRKNIFIDNLPESYAKMESGLGSIHLKHLAIIPLLQDNKLNGLMELTSFEKMEDYKITFLEKLAENLASSIEIVRVNERTNRLVDQLNSHTEELNAQKEEMQQNLEEMMATQEEMHRIRSQENKKEDDIKEHSILLKNKQEELSQKSTLLEAILSNITEQICILDEKNNILCASKSFLSGMNVETPDYVNQPLEKILKENTILKIFQTSLKPKKPTKSTADSKIQIPEYSPAPGVVLKGNTFPVFTSSSGKITGTMLSTTDVSVLHELEKKYNDLLTRLKQ